MSRRVPTCLCLTKQASTFDERRFKGSGGFPSLDIPWRGDERLETPTISPIPDGLVLEIVAGLVAALEQFREIAVDLGQARI